MTEKQKELQLRTDVAQRDFLNALENARGLVSLAAKMSGVSRITHYSWLKKYPEYVERVNEITDRNLDEVENVLLEKIFNDRDTTAIIFYLKTKGKARGYVEQTPNFVNVNVTGFDITIHESRNEGYAAIEGDYVVPSRPEQADIGASGREPEQQNVFDSPSAGYYFEHT